MKKFPIKYLEENLVFGQDPENVWAYYEWQPYNYSCISEDKAAVIFRGILADAFQMRRKPDAFFDADVGGKPA